MNNFELYFLVISFNSHYVGTVYPIVLSFGTFVSDYNINVQVQENLPYLFNLGIKDALKGDTFKCSANERIANLVAGYTRAAEPQLINSFKGLLIII